MSACETELIHRRSVGALMALAALVVTVAPLSGCNTTEGAGEDIESLGHSIDEAAEDAKN